MCIRDRICKCGERVLEQDLFDNFIDLKGLLVLSKSANDTFYSKSDMDSLKASGTVVEIDFSSKLRDLLIPSLKKVTTLIVDHNNIEEVMEISSLFKLQKIGVRLNHKHPLTIFSSHRVSRLEAKTGVKTLELILSFSAEEEIFPSYAYIMYANAFRKCYDCTSQKLDNLVLAVEIENRRIIKWVISQAPAAQVENHLNLLVGEEEEERKETELRQLNSLY